MKRGIIFDMDGTLWDSAAGVAASWTEIVQKQYKKDMIITEQDVKSVMGKTMDVIAEIVFPELSKDEQKALLDACCNYENDYLRVHGGMIYPDLEKTLVELQKKYSLYIVSNCQSGYIEAFLEHYGFGHYFDDIECYGNNEKSKGENIKLVMDRNALDQTIYVGDIQGDYEATCQAGATFIHAKYGFGSISDKVPEINQFSELLRVADEVFEDMQ